MRARNLDRPVDAGVLERAGLSEAAAVRLYRLLAIGGYDERYVIPAQQREEQDPHARKGANGFGILTKAGRGK
jgi:nitrate reductase beta subunit